MNDVEIQKLLLDLIKATTVSTIPEIVKAKLQKCKQSKFAFIEPSFNWFKEGITLTLKNIGYEKAFDICYIIPNWGNENLSEFTLNPNEQISFNIGLDDYDDDIGIIAITWLDSNKRKVECYCFNLLRDPIEINNVENKNQITFKNI